MSEFDATTLAAVRAAARAGEPDRYFAALLAPAAEQDRSLALAAFAAEVGRVADVVSEPVMGELRLQWWRDALAGLARGARTGNPVADALAAPIRAGRIDAAALERLIDARAFDLYADPMPDAGTFAAYLAATEATLFAAVAGASVSSALIADAARAYGTARTLAGLPAALSRGRLRLPLDGAVAAGVTPETLLAGTTTPEVRLWLGGLARDVRATLASLRQPIASLPRPQRVAFLPLRMIEPYLQSMEAAGSDWLRSRREVAPLTRVWRIGVGYVRW